MTSFQQDPADDPVESQRPPVRSSPELRVALVHVAVTLVFTLGFFFVAAASSGGLRTVLFVLAPLVALVGALGAIGRTYFSWKSRGRWQIWQGASWFLLVTFIAVLTGIAPVVME